MAKLLRTNGVGSAQTTAETQDSKIKIYDDKAAADLDLANIEENEIVATKAGESEGVVEVVDTVEKNNPNAVSSGAVFDFVTSKELDWDNAKVIGGGSMNFFAAGHAGTYVDINGNSHELGNTGSFDVAWNVTQTGRLFPCREGIKDSTTAAALSPLSEYPTIQLCTETCTIESYGAPYTPEHNKPLFRLTKNGSTVHEWNAVAAGVNYTPTSATGERMVRIRYSSPLQDLVGIEVDTSCRLTSLKQYNPAAIAASTASEVPLLVFVPYKN